ncbi:ATP-dependent DNA helicase [Candidatus Woesearchaeota archaeon]|nr:ATP-dependent DNA helicase [Candidatus Woesearchaeota archaeon]
MLTEELQKEIYFPYSKIRDVQSNMISDVYSAVRERKHIIMHAPTGIGKTIAVLAPALSFAMKHELTIFFLTSRQTQHKIVIDTLKQIRQKFNLYFETVDVIGKKWMCLQNSVEAMQSGSFHEYCRKLRDEKNCEFYMNTIKETGAATVEVKLALEELKVASPCHVQEYVIKAKEKRLCPYELALLNSPKAKVVVADYYYMFNDSIRNGFLMKMRKKLEQCIVVVDEAHNLPNRLRELMTHKTSSVAIEIAKKEAARFGFETVNLEFVEAALFELAKEIEEEDVVSRNSFVDLIEKYKKYDEVVAELIFAGENIRDKQKISYLLNVGKFLEAWLGPDKGFGRILSKAIDRKMKISLVYRCLDPSIAAKEVIDNSYSTLLMSGTLTPTSMYRDLLGYTHVVEREYNSPFPKKNRLNLIIPKTTTRFTERTHRQFGEIAKVCSDIANCVNGNCAMFFPSYDLMLNIHEHFRKMCSRTVFMEKQVSKKEEKEMQLASFVKNPESVLMATSTGSFGEGIDLPGILKAVIIVGLPLNKPDVEARLLIQYYGDKYSKGMEYGYILPAITKCVQNAGRCIRSETDKGAIIFLDERYASPVYHECFPEEWDMEVSLDYLRELKGFFGR